MEWVALHRTMVEFGLPLALCIAGWWFLWPHRRNRLERPEPETLEQCRAQLERIAAAPGDTEEDWVLFVAKGGTLHAHGKANARVRAIFLCELLSVCDPAVCALVFSEHAGRQIQARQFEELMTGAPAEASPDKPTAARKACPQDRLLRL